MGNFLDGLFNLLHIKWIKLVDHKLIYGNKGLRYEY